MKQNIVNKWVEYAQNNLDVAIREMERQCNPRLRPYEIILYNCQQSAEKMLKSYLVNNGVTIPYTHDLPDLRSRCAGFDNSYNGQRIVDHCAFLTVFATVRYPDFTGSIDSSHATRGINSAKRIHDFVCIRLGMPKKYYQ